MRIPHHLRTDTSTALNARVVRTNFKAEELEGLGNWCVQSEFVKVDRVVVIATHNQSDVCASGWGRGDAQVGCVVSH